MVRNTYRVYRGERTKTHQENMRVIFDVFVSGNHIFEHYVFVMKVFQGLCLWIQVLDIK